MIKICKNCEHEIDIVLIGKVKRHWHTYNLIKDGATLEDCACGCSKPEWKQEKT